MRKEKGFTLIELLVVVAIIGILAAIAIPQFAEYRKRAFDSQAVSDLRNAATAEEAVFVDTDAYVACADGAACQAALPGYRWSNQDADATKSVVIAMTAEDPGVAFTGHSSHPNGNNVAGFDWDSQNGGLQD